MAAAVVKLGCREYLKVGTWMIPLDETTSVEYLMAENGSVRVSGDPGLEVTWEASE